MNKKKKESEIDLLKNQLARALADYDNFRKRIERDKEKSEVVANFKLIIKLLPVFDMLLEAQEHLKDSGLALTIKEFKEVLEEENVERINAENGTFFDANIHEAVEIETKGKGKNGEILEEILSGWKYKDGPVIRPAKVKVLKK